MRPASTLAGIAVGGDSPVRVMAAVNISPESFYAGSVVADAAALRDAVQRAEAEGACFIDVGAKSTAPYLDTAIPLEEEVSRMSWALRVIVAAVSVPVSADTTRAMVAAAALAGGARIINDVSGLRDDRAMADVCAQGEGVILAASPDGTDGGEPVTEVRRLLADSLGRAARAGIGADAVVLDPGIGFFTKSGIPATEFNCQVLRRLSELEQLGCPLLVGVSRKSFIGRLTGRTEPGDRLAGSLGATAVAVYNGAAIIRTHDVAATRDAVRVAEAIRGAGAPASRGTPPS
jgi:dihydropteroate synthase